MGGGPGGAKFPPSLRLFCFWALLFFLPSCVKASCSSPAHSRRFSASAFVNTPGIRVPQFSQQPFFSRFDMTECQERVITICLHPGQIVLAPSEKMLPSDRKSTRLNSSHAN